MALMVGGQAVAVGITQMGDGLQIRPFAKTDWLMIEGDDRLTRASHSFRNPSCRWRLQSLRTR